MCVGGYYSSRVFLCAEKPAGLCDNRMRAVCILFYCCIIIVVLLYYLCYTICMETVLIRIRKDDRDKLKSLAERDGRTVVSFLHRLIGEPSPIKGPRSVSDDKMEAEYKQYAASLSGLPSLTRSSRLATWRKEHNYEPSSD